MPFYDELTPEADFRIGIWQIEENEGFGDFNLNSSQFEEPYFKVNTALQKQRICTLALLQKMTGMQLNSIGHDQLGKPTLPAGMGHVGISHTKDWVVIGLHKSIASIGIDVEKIQPRIAQVARRFLGNKELQDIARLQLDSLDELRMYTIYWCGKEAFYKSMPGVGYSYQLGIQVEPFALVDGQFEIKFETTENGVNNPVRKKMKYLHLNGHELVYCTA